MIDLQQYMAMWRCGIRGEKRRSGSAAKNRQGKDYIGHNFQEENQLD